MKIQKLDDFTLGYIECMLWAENDESNEQGGEPLEENYDIDDIAPETMWLIIADCVKFQRENAADLAGLPSDIAGHDFWLTRKGHGAGFWDGDYPDTVGARLTNASKRFSKVTPYVGDDGLLYLL